jgi:hypothetical protein
VSTTSLMTSRPEPGADDAGPGTPGAADPRRRMRERAERAAFRREQAKRTRALADGIVADDPATARLLRAEADGIEAAAARELEVGAPLARGLGGEVVPTDGDPAVPEGYAEKVLGAELTSVEAGLRRMELASEAACLSEALDAAAAVGAKDSVERMLAHQLAAAHRLAMKFAAKAEQQVSQVADWQAQARQQVHAIEAARLAGTAARLMAAFRQGAEALGRYRSGGRQQIVVQRISVTDGGQAVVAGAVTPSDAGTGRGK